MKVSDAGRAFIERNEGCSLDSLMSRACPEPNTGCWLWTRSLSSSGYGQVSYKGRPVRAHRLAFFLRHGRWPSECACHRCDTRACINPDHLFEGTRADNVADMLAKGRQATPEAHGRHQKAKTHCARGHEYSEENTWLRHRNGAMHRQCRTCNRERARGRP